MTTHLLLFIEVSSSKRLYSINGNFNDMSCKTLFLYILATEEENIITLSGAYIDDILKHDNRESLCLSVSQLRVR